VGHGVVVSALGLELVLVFLAPKEEELVLGVVFEFGEEDRAADGVTGVVEAELVALQAIAVVLPVVGVQAVIAVEEVTGAVKLARSGLGDHADLRAGGPSVFGLVIRSKNSELLHGIERDGGELVTVVAGIDVADAVQREVVLVGARAVGGDGADTAVARGLQIHGAYHAGDQLGEI